MKIYTRTGDDGTTGLFSGDRVSKTSPRIEAHGAVDELNSLLGVAAAAGPQPIVAGWVREVQARLFVAGADLATPGLDDRVPRITTADVGWLEERIDEMDAGLPALRNFILPGGTPAAAHLHVARAVARRAERDVLRLVEAEPVNGSVAIYLNRLSDFLFVLARYENHLAGVPETEWRG